MLPYPDMRPQNRFTGFVYPMSTEEIPENPIPCLNSVGETRKRHLLTSQTLVLYYLLKILGRFPCSLARLPVRHGTAFSLLYTSVPVSRNRLTLLDNKLEYTIAWPTLINDCGELQNIFKCIV